VAHISHNCNSCVYCFVVFLFKFQKLKGQTFNAAVPPLSTTRRRLLFIRPFWRFPLRTPISSSSPSSRRFTRKPSNRTPAHRDTPPRGPRSPGMTRLSTTCSLELLPKPLPEEEVGITWEGKTRDPPPDTGTRKKKSASSRSEQRWAHLRKRGRGYWRKLRRRYWQPCERRRRRWRRRDSFQVCL